MRRKPKKENRFEVLHEETIAVYRSATILRDKETGVCYLYSAAGYGAGLTPLLDANGKPIVAASTAYSTALD